MESFFQDLRFALRTLRKSPGVTLLSVGSLALAIFGNTTVFSLTNAFLYRPLPYEEPHRLAFLAERSMDLPQGQITAGSLANVLDLEERQSSFQSIEAYQPSAYSLDTGGDRPEQLVAGDVTPGFFQALGVSPLFGRTFLEEESTPGRNKVVILSYELWNEQFGGRRDLEGESLTLNGEPYEILGAMPPDFEFLIPNTKLFTPLAFERSELQRHQRSVLPFGRLRPGVDDSAADAEMATLMSQLAEQYPDENRGYTLDVLNLREEIPDPNSRFFLKLIQGALLFVLLIACANIANLLLARSQKREREIAIRTCMGADKKRITRQLFTESLLMALTAGALGILLAHFGITLLFQQLAQFMPRFWVPVIDQRVLGFNLFVTLLGALLFSLAPILQLSTGNLLPSLKDGTQASTGGKKRRLISNGLVVLELALALVFLAGAGILVSTFNAMQNSEGGFELEGVLDATVVLPASRYAGDEQLVAQTNELKERLAALPGVEQVTLSNTNARTPFLVRDLFSIDDKPLGPDQSPRRAMSIIASAEYFEAFDIAVLQGRDFDESDRLEAPQVMMINQSLAERYWPDEDPLGQRATVRGASREVIGVVKDVQHWLVTNEDLAPVLYLPWSQEPASQMVFSLHGSSDMNSLADPMRSTLQDFDRDLAIPEIITLEALVDRFWSGQKAFSLILVSFGILALFLAAIGTYGVQAYSVVQRTHEIGIRVAVGAQRSQVVGLITRQGIFLGLLGLALGVPGIFFTSQAITAIYAGFVTVETGSVLGVAVLLLVVVVLASFLPARRAASVDPMDALRAE